jgi:two-component system sensor histidine kinase/response regulator
VAAPPDNLALLAAELRDAGFEPVLAESGPAALALVASRLFDAVILDVNMPGQSGLQVFTELRKTYDLTRLPVLMATALGRPDDATRALRLGANDYVVKPLDMEILLARLRTQLAVGQLTRERDELASIRDDFVAIAAHDLRNPLTEILAAVDLVRIGLSRPEPKAERWLDVIGTARARIQRLVSDFVDCRLLESGKFEVASYPVDLAALATEAVERFRPRAVEKGISLALDFSARPVVAGDGDRIRQILVNLVENALKYTLPRTHVRVRIGQDQTSALIEVEDEGPGFTEADLKKVFGRFARLTARPSGGERSSGLGLYITRMLVEAHSGQIRATNRLGGGARMRVELPLRR